MEDHNLMDHSPTRRVSLADSVADEQDAKRQTDEEQEVGARLTADKQADMRGDGNSDTVHARCHMKWWRT